MLVNFAIVQVAPGGPVERLMGQLKGHDLGGGATARISGAVGETAIAGDSRAGRGIEPEFIKEIEKLYGFDKPAHERFFKMVKQYATFDFGESFYRDQSVVSLVAEKLPVSISLGLWTTLLIYLVSIPLGIAKAVRDGTKFDLWSSAAIIVGYAIPGFLFAVILIVLFSGGSYFSWFPLRGLTSDGWESFSLLGKIADYFWHLALPLTAMTVGGFATLTMLTKNSFMDEIHKQYVVTARAKGLGEQRILYGHVFRNAMLIVVAGFPQAFLSIFFAGSILIETIFSLDGLGLLGFESAVNRDYPVMFATVYVFSLLGLVFNLISDLTYMAIDPRIDFDKRQG
jgi:microcin C transport system permease protein